MKEFKETSYCQDNDFNYATISTSETVWINKIKRLSELYPDDVKIQHINKDGSLYAHVPLGWFKLSPPKKVSMTDEQKVAASLRLQMARDIKLNKER
jgi:hypothetical protein